MKDISRGILIVIEGIDNSGKTTIIELIKHQLSHIDNLVIRNYFQEKILVTSEPYGPKPTPLKYRQISEIIFSEKYDIQPETEALLFMAARNEHISTFIKPELENGSLVICDRFYLSSLVYQSILKKVDFDWLLKNNLFILGQIKPTITFFVEIDIHQYNTALMKKKSENKLNKYDLDRFTFKELQDAYYEAIKHLQKRGENFIVVPSSLSLEEKSKFIISNIKKIIR